MRKTFILMLLASLALFSCKKAPAGLGEPEGPLPEPDNTISILAIGNSFSVDGMQYLYDVLAADGAENIVLGNLYISGCTLATHAGHFAENDAAYTYYHNTTGSWTSTANTCPLDALQERDWDYITLQQASGVSGKPDTYSPYLDQIVAVVKEHCPGAKLVWHMTWAYQGNSTHSAFPNYGSNQMTMYNAIVSAVNEKILSRGDFSAVIPSGTAVQNLRTSLYGDRITRDGYHLSYDAGRFVAALTWAGTLFGTQAKQSTWKPAAYTYSDAQLGAIREAAAAAVQNPYTISTSSYPPDPILDDGSLAALISAAGYNPDEYSQMEIDWTLFAYYNSTNATMLSTLYTHENSTQTNLDEFVATPIYDKTQLPVGSLLVVKDGYQYRPEGWVTLTTKNDSSARPGNVTATVQEVTESWWGSWNYRAFNICKPNGSKRTVFTEETALEACKAFGIFLPAKD